jgi:hypothetical protein
MRMMSDVSDVTRTLARSAYELDYRQRQRTWRRRGAIAGGVVGVVLAVMLLLRFGGKGGRLIPPKVRLSATGLTVDGVPASVGEAVVACQRAGRCEVVVTGDARQGDWEVLLNALVVARVPFHVR